MIGSRTSRIGWGPIEVAVLRRALVLWVLIRVAVAGLLLLAKDGHPLSIDPRAALIIVATVGVLSWVDTKRRNEDVLLANLGTSRWTIHVVSVGPALMLEGLLGVVSRL
jgi:hypothetical protein